MRVTVVATLALALCLALSIVTDADQGDKKRGGNTPTPTTTTTTRSTGRKIPLDKNEVEETSRDEDGSSGRMKKSGSEVAGSRTNVNILRETAALLAEWAKFMFTSQISFFPRGQVQCNRLTSGWFLASRRAAEHAHALFNQAQHILRQMRSNDLEDLIGPFRQRTQDILTQFERCDQQGDVAEFPDFTAAQNEEAHTHAAKVVSSLLRAVKTLRVPDSGTSGSRKEKEEKERKYGSSSKEDKVGRESLVVLVVGGGPVGLVNAIMLAREGHQVTLVETRSFDTSEDSVNNYGGSAFYRNQIVRLDNLVSANMKSYLNPVWRSMFYTGEIENVPGAGLIQAAGPNQRLGPQKKERGNPINPGSVTFNANIRLNVLQHLLLDLALSEGVRIEDCTKFVGFQQDGDDIVARLEMDISEKRKEVCAARNRERHENLPKYLSEEGFRFDMLIGADGKFSRTRKALLCTALMENPEANLGDFEPTAEQVKNECARYTTGATSADGVLVFVDEPADTGHDSLDTAINLDTVFTACDRLPIGDGTAVLGAAQLPGCYKKEQTTKVQNSREGRVSRNAGQDMVFRGFHNYEYPPLHLKKALHYMGLGVYKTEDHKGFLKEDEDQDVNEDKENEKENSALLQKLKKEKRGKKDGEEEMFKPDEERPVCPSPKISAELWEKTVLPTVHNFFPVGDILNPEGPADCVRSDKIEIKMAYAKDVELFRKRSRQVISIEGDAHHSANFLRASGLNTALRGVFSNNPVFLQGETLEKLHRFSTTDVANALWGVDAAGGPASMINILQSRRLSGLMYGLGAFRSGQVCIDFIRTRGERGICLPPFVYNDEEDMFAFAAFAAVHGEHLARRKAGCDMIKAQFKLGHNLLNYLDTNLNAAIGRGVKHCFKENGGKEWQGIYRWYKTYFFYWKVVQARFSGSRVSPALPEGTGLGPFTILDIGGGRIAESRRHPAQNWRNDDIDAMFDVVLYFSEGDAQDSGEFVSLLFRLYVDLAELDAAQKHEEERTERFEELRALAPHLKTRACDVLNSPQIRNNVGVLGPLEDLMKSTVDANKENCDETPDTSGGDSSSALGSSVRGSESSTLAEVEPEPVLTTRVEGL